jgi:hypothetical protein
MPTFCRHGRFVQNCAICREPEPPKAATRAPRRPSARRAGGGGSGGRARGAGAGLVVRRAERATADGYACGLVPGLGASDDARRLADELAFSAGRLAELATAPPGLYAEAASAPDPEEGIWLVLQITYLGPLEDDDPWAAIRRERVSWESGGEPSLLDEASLGPRTAHDPGRPAQAFAAYRTWADRAGGQLAGLTGEGGWRPDRRFERAFDRLSLPGLGRAARFEFLTAAGRLGLVDMSAETLKLALADDVNLAAKRVFGIGDPLLLDRRARELAEAAGIPLAALDLALFNWDRPAGGRATMGASAEAASQHAAIAAALGL